MATPSSSPTALVTGGYRGIGLEVARQLAQRGFRVFIGARRPEKAQAAVAEIGSGAEYLPLDVSDDASITAAAATLAGQIDHLDVLVNNAAILRDMEGSVLALSSDLLLETLQTNTFGPLRVTQALLPLLRKSTSARVINISSGGGQLSGGSDTWAPAYCISKTALNGVTGQLAAALQGEGIAVNSVCPGWVRTEMGGSAAPRSVEQGADTIVWLASEAPAELTGKFLRDRQEIPW